MNLDECYEINIILIKYYSILHTSNVRLVVLSHLNLQNFILKFLSLKGVYSNKYPNTGQGIYTG